MEQVVSRLARVEALRREREQAVRAAQEQEQRQRMAAAVAEYEARRPREDVAGPL